MAQDLGHVGPEQLARELKIVVNVGLRPPKVRAELRRLPLLAQLASSDPVGTTDWDVAIAVCSLVTTAVESFGDGPYGLAASALFGTSASTRGLLKTRRRSSAAAELDTEVATFVRHWEADLLVDVAVAILRTPTLL